jgi:hypothetical protein
MLSFLLNILVLLLYITVVGYASYITLKIYVKLHLIREASN